MNVTKEARRSILVDLLTVHALGGKAIVFTQTKREADEVAASLSLVHPCEVRGSSVCGCAVYVICCTLKPVILLGNLASAPAVPV